MATEGRTGRTRVNERGMVTIPADLRHRLDIEPGDVLRWEVTGPGELSVEVVRQRFGAFDEFEAVPMGGDGLETHDVAGYDRSREEQG